MPHWNTVATYVQDGAFDKCIIVNIARISQKDSNHSIDITPPKKIVFVQHPLQLVLAELRTVSRLNLQTPKCASIVSAVTSR